jgi:hypothetical protein
MKISRTKLSYAVTTAVLGISVSASAVAFGGKKVGFCSAFSKTTKSIQSTIKRHAVKHQSVKKHHHKKHHHKKHHHKKHHHKKHQHKTVCANETGTTDGLDIKVASSHKPVIVKFLGSEAYYSSDLYLMQNADGKPGVDAILDNDRFIINNKSARYHQRVNLGKYPKGTVLTFRLHVNNTDSNFVTGAASDNPDNLVHAKVVAAKKKKLTHISFEDTLSADKSADYDFNDFVVVASNTRPYKDCSVEEVTEPDPVVVISSEDEAHAVVFEPVEETTTNIVVTLDVSFSMLPAWNDENVDRLALAKETITNLINSYSDQGDVNVKVVDFSGDYVVSDWMNADAAITHVNALSARPSGTNYEAATFGTYSNYTAPEADKTVAYLISDGVPTVEFVGDSETRTTTVNNNDGEGWLDSNYVEAWATFNDTYVDELHVVALGSGITDTSYLDMLAEAGGVSTNVVEDSTELNAEIQKTVVPPQEIDGNLLDNVHDASGDLSITSIDMDGASYTAADMPVTTTAGSTLDVDFDTGNFSYTVNASDFSEDTTEVFTVNASDSDGGDTTDFKVYINIDVDDGSTYAPENDLKVYTEPQTEESE